MSGRRARLGAGSIAGALALMAGLGACTNPPPATPTCAAPTQIISGYPDPNGPFPTPGWYSADTRANGSVRVDSTFGAPSGFGCNAAVFTTGDTGVGGLDKAQLADFDMAGQPLSAINNISYQAYRSSLSPSGTVAALAFNVSVTNLSTAVTLVYEPYMQSGGASAIHNDTWQQWNASAGVWWTPEIAAGQPGSQGMPQPWSFFQTTYGAGWFVAAYGLDIGSSNPHMYVAGDDIVFGPKTVDF